MLQGNDKNFASEYFWNLKVDNYSIRVKLDCCPIPGLNFDQLASNLAPSPPGQRSPFYYSFMLAQDSPLFYSTFIPQVNDEQLQLVSICLLQFCDKLAFAGSLDCAMSGTVGILFFA